MHGFTLPRTCDFKPPALVIHHGTRLHACGTHNPPLVFRIIPPIPPNESVTALMLAVWGLKV